MKTLFVFFFTLIFVALISQISAQNAQPGLSSEAHTRKGTCGGLVHKKGPGSGESHGASGESNPSPPTPGSPPTGSTQGQCVCETGTLATGMTQGGVTQGGVTQGQGNGQGSSSVEFDCELTEALYNMSLLLSGEEYTLWLELIESIEVILVEVDLTDIEKVVLCSNLIRNFCEVHVDVFYLLAFQTISDWGCLFDFIMVSVDLEADISDVVITLDQNGDCELFDALVNATEGNQQQHQAVLVLIEEIKVVLVDVELTSAQKYAKIYLLFVQFFAEHSQWESFFLDIEISVEFGTLEGFFRICHGYYRVLTIYEVLGGTSDDDCVFLAALTAAVNNASYTLSDRGQLKQLHDKCEAFFATNFDIQARLTFVSQTCYQMFLVEEFIIPVLDLIVIEVDGSFWGYIYHILWCSEFCANEGTCGNIDNGLGTTPAPSTTTVAATTQGASTVVPHDCSTRVELVVISSQNTTYFTSAFFAAYNTFNASVQNNMNTYKNQMIGCVYNKTATNAQKVTQLVTFSQNYNKNQPASQAILFDIFIQIWNGNIGNFVACGPD